MLAGENAAVYVEADSDLVELVRLILGRRGLSVAAAGTDEGLSSVRRSRPDVVLLEPSVPDGDGWELYRQLRADPETRDIPVIVVTGRAGGVDQVLGMHLAGVDGYVTKPFRPQELVRSVRRVLARVR